MGKSSASVGRACEQLAEGLRLHAIKHVVRVRGTRTYWTGAYSVFTIFQPSVVWTEKGGFLWRKYSAIGAEPEGRAQENHAVVGWYPKVGRCGRRVVPEGRPMRSSGGTRRSANALIGAEPEGRARRNLP